MIALKHFAILFLQVSYALNIIPEPRLQADLQNDGLLSPHKHSNVTNIKYCNSRNYHVYAVTLLICSFLLALFHLILIEQFNYRGVNNITDRHYRHS